MTCVIFVKSVQQPLESRINTGFLLGNALKNTAGAVFFSFYSYHYILWFFTKELTTVPRRPHRYCLSGFVQVRCQMSSLYCRMVLSDEKNPALAILTSIILTHLSRSS